LKILIDLLPMPIILQVRVVASGPQAEARPYVISQGRANAKDREIDRLYREKQILK
jgi:hypothetical protein